MIRKDAKKRKYEYFYPLYELLADGETVFLFLKDSYNQSRYEFKEGVEVKYLAEVLDAGTGEFLRSVYFPFIPAVIKNGYAYKRARSEESFSIIRKYKIDQAVYGK
ncbi:hypothetical protein AMJ80_00015 [bacterium SM23_31]|nr:MAG: hypothetical protein AMJ80_00015 [bacterium SM23_31]